MTMIKALAMGACCGIGATFMPIGADAQDVRITTFKGNINFMMGGQNYTISRNQDQAATLTGEMSRTSRACPPSCVQPMRAATGVVTLGELELLSFLQNQVSDSVGLLIDVRSPDEFARTSIPGAVNVPTETLDSENRYLVDILRALGAAGDPTELDFTAALDLTIYAGGSWSPDAPQAIQHLINAGYPADRLHYYRGGLQAWMSLGLTTTATQTPG